jgi:hypothetical protein
VEVVRLALPATNVAVPSTVGPSLKLTLPLGVPLPGASADTFAVNVSGCPNVFEPELIRTPMADEACRTVKTNGVPPLSTPLQLASPL